MMKDLWFLKKFESVKKQTYETKSDLLEMLAWLNKDNGDVQYEFTFTPSYAKLGSVKGKNFQIWFKPSSGRMMKDYCSEVGKKLELRDDTVVNLKWFRNINVSHDVLDHSK